MSTAQRFTNIAPGDLTKRLQGIARVQATEKTLDALYLETVRECPCLKCGLDPCRQAAHVRMQSGAFNKRGGTAKTPEDRWALPLCGSGTSGCHGEQHKIGEASFWFNVGINPLLICEKLYTKRGDIPAMRAVIFNAIAEREAVSQFRGIGKTSRSAKPR